MNLKTTVINFFKTNPHLGPSLFLFCLGVIFLTTTRFATVSGALFGAGASLLGAWISDINTRSREFNSKIKKENEAVQYLSPELLRTVVRLLHIQERAIINFSVNWAENIKNGELRLPLASNIHDLVNLGDLKEDFLPQLPHLYPNAIQFKDLNGSKAIKLVLYYDSLFELEIFVKDWWKREGQVPSNLFNQISHISEKSLRLALECLAEFEINHSNYDTPHVGTIPERISKALEGASQTRERCSANFAKAKASRTDPDPEFAEKSTGCQNMQPT
ncbi:hypothetical protein [Enterobacter sp. C4G1]|uniref:hypothetical protein n=1 Tax=Enterobacter sp. C4G1 TaxID=3458724 RepID=UPI0040685FF2